MKHNFFSMHFLLVPFSTCDDRQTFNVPNSEIRFSLHSYSFLSQWKFLKELNVSVRYNVKY